MLDSALKELQGIQSPPPRQAGPRGWTAGASKRVAITLASILVVVLLGLALDRARSASSETQAETQSELCPGDDLRSHMCQVASHGGFVAVLDL